jgi:hypothetical protein
MWQQEYFSIRGALRGTLIIDASKYRNLTRAEAEICWLLCCLIKEQTALPSSTDGCKLLLACFSAWDLAVGLRNLLEISLTLAPY